MDPVFSNLLSGLVGAVIGAAVVVMADRYRWRKENKAAARLVYYEVLNNRTFLDAIVSSGVGELGSMISQSVWQAQQVRVASLLRGRSLAQISAAQLTLTGILTTRAIIGHAAWAKEVNAGDGKLRVSSTLDLLHKSEAILMQSVDERGWAERKWQATRQSAARAWKAGADRAKKLRS